MVDYIVALKPHDFARLHNPVMRRLMAPRITLGRVAAMARIPVNELLERIAVISGAVAERHEQSEPLPNSAHERPPWVAHTDSTSVKTVNLLPIDEALNEDPLPLVTAAIKALSPGEVLWIKHRWEP